MCFNRVLKFPKIMSKNIKHPTSHTINASTQAYGSYYSSNPSHQPVEIARGWFSVWNWDLFWTLATFASEFQVEEWDKTKT
mmetsp:Transcript_22515/g.55722  ORF Transcript_22515/g.55722 Transcript_22515/m.55722 type:complete len:81 (+) Transcript_22515:2269-2511(+)